MPDTTDDKMASKFTGLPMNQLIAAPLIAAADANIRMAGATYEFIDKVWLESKEGDSNELKPRMLDFALNRKDNSGQDVNYQVHAPFAALVQTPNLMIQTVDVDFTMEVKDSETHKDESTATASFEGSANYMFFKVHVSGSVSTSSSNTRSSDQSAKYDVRVHAEQAKTTEGMNRLAQIFASVIEPVKLGEAA